MCTVLTLTVGNKMAMLSVETLFTIVLDILGDTNSWVYSFLTFWIWMQFQKLSGFDLVCS